MSWRYLVVLTTLAIAATSHIDDDYAFSHSNISYSPSMYVEYGHKLSTQEFSTSQSYLKRVAYTPAAIFVLGALAIFFYSCGLLFRCCCKCCACLPDFKDDDNISSRKLYNNIAFYALCVLVLVFDQLVFIGNNYLNTGILTVKSSITDLKGIFTGATSDADTLIDDGNTMLSFYSSMQADSCYDSSYSSTNITSQVNSCISNLNSANSFMKSVPDELDMALSYIDTYALFYRNIALYVVWGLAIASVIVYITCHCCQTIGGMKFSISFSLTTYILYLILGIPWGAITSLLGDFCMGPLNYLAQSTSGGLHDQVVYFATCVGDNVVLSSGFDAAKSGLSSLNSSIASMIDTYNQNSFACPSGSQMGTYLHGMKDLTKNMFTALDSAEDTLACGPFQSVVVKFVETGMCGSFYSGIFLIWGSQLITSFLLFMLMVLASFVYHYYPNAKVSPDDEEYDDDEEVDEEGDNAFIEEYEKKKHDHDDDAAGGKKGKHSKRKHEEEGDEEETRMVEVRGHQPHKGKGERMPHKSQIVDEAEAYFV